MKSDNAPRNVPQAVLDELAERRQTIDEGGFLAGLVGEERSTPRPHEGVKPARHHTPKRVSDIRSGHNYT